MKRNWRRLPHEYRDDLSACDDALYSIFANGAQAGAAICEALSDGTEVEQLALILQQSNLTEKVITTLAHSQSSRVLEALVTYHQVPSKLVDEFILNKKVLLKVLSHQNLTPSQLMSIVRSSPGSQIVSEIVSNFGDQRAVLDLIAEICTEEECLPLIRSSLLNAHGARRFAASPLLLTRLQLASGRGLPHDAALRLFCDRSLAVRLLAAQHLHQVSPMSSPNFSLDSWIVDIFGRSNKSLRRVAIIAFRSVPLLICFLITSSVLRHRFRHDPFGTASLLQEILTSDDARDARGVLGHVEMSTALNIDSLDVGKLATGFSFAKLRKFFLSLTPGESRVHDFQESLNMFSHNPEVASTALRENPEVFEDVHLMHDLLSLTLGDQEQQEFQLNLYERFPNLQQVAHEPLQGHNPNAALYVRIPETNHTLIGWGNILSICVGNGQYADSAAKGHCAILGLFDGKGALQFVAEVVGSEIVQCRGFANKQAPNEVVEALRRRIHAQQ